MRFTVQILKTNCKTYNVNVNTSMKLKVAALAFNVFFNLFMLMTDTFAVKTTIQMITFSSFYA